MALLNKKLLNQLLDTKKQIGKESYNYRQDELTEGIVHIGVGNFHRSHQAYYLDKLFNLRKEFNWGIVGASIRNEDATIQQELINQDCLSTLISKDTKNEDVHIQQSMIDFLPIDNALLVEKLCNEDIKIVSLTITEGGYYLNPKGDSVNIEHPSLQEDIQNYKNPKNIFGVLLNAIKQRKDLGIKPFTILSCDNIPSNGKILKDGLIKLSEIIYPKLTDYIDALSFPCSMVDRITPSTSNEDMAYLEDNYDYLDKRPISCEPFTQWFLEDTFNNDRPALELVGVNFVSKIEEYEAMKLHILNGGHAIIAYPAHLLGIEYSSDAMANDLIFNFLDKIVKNEVLPVVQAPAGISTDEYFEIIKERFANTKVKDTITRLCTDGFNRQPKFILSSIKKALKASKNIDGLVIANALWCRYCAGYDENEKAFDVEDGNKELLIQKAKLAKDNPIEFLKIQDVYGDLVDNKIFTDKFGQTLNAIYEKGTTSVINTYLAKGHL